jgi:uncharacterized metal-binding protein YceD (DUF177 family)
VYSFDKSFDINFSSLKTGIHEFKYVLNDTFFDQTELERDFENSEITFDIRLEKSETMMTFRFNLDGKAEMPCGRCTDLMEFIFDGSYKQIVQFGEENFNTDEIIVVAPSEYKINIGTLLYEFSILSMPSNIFHEDENDCNKEYLESISDYLLTEIDEETDVEEENNEDIDPRWSQLKNLKNKNN